MNKKMFKLLTAGAFALLSSCGNDSTDSAIEYAENAPMQTKATLYVLVRDASTGLTLSGASVKLLSNGDTTATSAAGTSSFKDVPTGTHRVLVKKDGYASAFGTVSITADAGENIFIARENTSEVLLYPLIAKLTGTLYYKDNAGQNKPAKDAEIAFMINSSSNIADSLVIKTKAGADGKYVFEKLPTIVASQYSVVAQEYKTTGTVYKPQTICANCGNLATDYAAYIGSYILDVNLIDEVFTVLSYSNYITDSSNVVIAFSNPVDLKKLVTSSLSVSDNNVADFIWNTKGDTLTVKPAGKWKTSFSVSIANVYSNNGKSLSSILPVIVNRIDLSGVKVSKPILVSPKPEEIDYGSNSLTIQWNKIPNVDGYKIYKKNIKSELAYSLISTAYAANSCGDVNSSICRTQFSLSVSNGDSVAIIIQAYDSQSQTKLETAADSSLKLWDRKKPTVELSPNGASPLINSFGVVKFGSKIYYESKNSYTYGLANGNGVNVSNVYSPNAYGLDSTQFGYFSDLAYYLSKPGAAVDVIKDGCTGFNEPMDTTAILTATSLPARVSATREWKDDQTLCFSFSVIAGTASNAPINIIYSISGLKDKTGNPLNIDYGNTGEKPTLDFKIKSEGYPTN